MKKKIIGICLCLSLLLCGCSATEEEKKQALNIAETLGVTMILSETSMREHIGDEYKFKYNKSIPEDALEYAMDNINIDYKKNALSTVMEYENGKIYKEEEIRNILMEQGYSDADIKFVLDKLN